jgi:putative endonuclease
MSYYVYIISSDTGTLYVGMTNNLKRRIYEHKHGSAPHFSKKYNIRNLLYFETFSDKNSAIARENQLKHWRREKKIALIDTVNDSWSNLMPPESPRPRPKAERRGLL